MKIKFVSIKTWKKGPKKLLRILNKFVFSTDLAVQKAHFWQKQEFNRLSVSPLYNLLGFDPMIEAIWPKVQSSAYVSDTLAWLHADSAS